MVAASNPPTAQAGLNILPMGGDATDPAIATTTVLNVTVPALYAIQLSLRHPRLSH
jgi:gamma-glutamyltranspeptidase